MTLHSETVQAPREASSWQVAMRSCPPGLWSPGNPGSSAGHERAWRSVPNLGSRQTPDLWPVGDLGAIRAYIDRVLDQISERLYGGREIPKMTVEQVAGSLDGAPLTVELPVDSFSRAQQDQLARDLDRGYTAFAESLRSLSGGEYGRGLAPRSVVPEGQLYDPSISPQQRAVEVALSSSGDLFEAITADGLTEAEQAGAILQQIANAMLAIAPSIPYGIGYAIAGLIQIGEWIAQTWDRTWEPAEKAGWRYWWSESQKKAILRYRLIVMTCAKPENIAQVNSMSVADVESWLDRTSQRMLRRSRDPVDCAAMLMGQNLHDTMETARLIKQIGTYLRYAGASETVVEDVVDWLWDARRMDRIAAGLGSGEITASGEYASIRNIGKFPNYWRDWAYAGTGMTPVRFPESQLSELHGWLRGLLVSEARSKVPVSRANIAKLGLQVARAAGAMELVDVNRSRAAELTVVVRQYTVQCYPNLPQGALDPGPETRALKVRARSRDWTCVCAGVQTPDQAEPYQRFVLHPSMYAAASAGRTGMAVRSMGGALGGAGLGLAGDADAMGVNQNEIRSAAFQAETRAAIERALGRPTWHLVVGAAVAVGAGAVIYEVAKPKGKRK